MSMNRDRKQQYLLIAAGLISFIAAAILLNTFKGQFGRDTAQSVTLPVMEDTIDVSASYEPEPAGAAKVSGDPRAKEAWVVYVTGAVKNPGVYEISPDARIYQALEAAGGFSGAADTEAVNLAAPLADGAHIRFPAKGEKKEAPAQQDISYLVLSSPEEPAARAARKIDLNRCTAKELEEIPGIGPKTALVIIQHREKNGGFRRVEDLLLVNGIGPKKYDVMKEFVIVAN